jgi:hypothetical protein
MDLADQPGQQARALSPRQESIVRRLREIGEGPAEFFVAACELLAEEPRHTGVTHLVAHLLREVESAVRSVLDPAGDASRGRDKHRASVIAVLDQLEISRDEPIAEFWLGLTGEGNPSGLGMRAHRSALEAPRPADSAFDDFVAGFEELLDRLLKRFEDRYVGVFTRLDELLKVTRPGAAHATQLRNNFPQNLITLGYFFVRADSTWLIPLRKEGFFSSPPEPVIHPGEGTAELPFWPQAHFLIRVACDDAAEVVATALDIPATDNSRVNSDLVELSLHVPPGQSARLLPQIIASLDSRFGVLVPTRTGGLCRHLAEGGYTEEAMRLTEALLAKVPDGTGSRAAADSWSYAEILREDIPAVTRAGGLPVLALLARLLDQAISAQTPGGLKDLRQDMSVSWRPALEGHPAGTDTDPATALVSAVRDAATQLLDTGDATISQVVAEMESHDWPIFRRLTLFLLTTHAHDAAGLIAAHLTDPGAIRDFNLNREFLALAQRHCTTIGPRDQQRLVALIGSGPETTEWSRRHEQTTGEPPSAAMTHDRVARWQRDRLAAVEPILSAEWRARYQRLVAEFGEAPDPAASTLIPVRDIAFTSPATAGDLAASPIEDLVNFLATWEPTGNLLEPSRFSLASALSTAIQHNAPRRSSEADAFIGLPAAYIAAVISALWIAVREKTELDWQPVLRLCAWADEQAAAELGDLPSGTRPQWRDSRLNVLRLLEAGLSAPDHPIPPDHRDQAWAIIESACNDPDPAPGDEASAYEAGQGPGEPGLEYIRPRALTAAVAYALWVRRNDPDARLDEFRRVLDSHLNPEQEPSRAVRWVYGSYFPQLTWLDRSWAVQNAASVFPAQTAERPLWEAAWDGYLSPSPLVADVCAILDDCYQLAVDRVDSAASERRAVARADGVGRHLVTRYWFGQISIESHRQLLRRFYQNAPSSVCLDLMRFIGRSLRQVDALDRAVADRLMRLWEARVQAVRNGADADELAGFGEWFAAGKLGDEWELRQLLTTLSLAGRVEFEHLVLPRLASLCHAHTGTCLAVLEAWVRTRPGPFQLQQHETSIRAILKTGLDDSDLAAAETAMTVISLCIAEGPDLRGILHTT